MASSSRKKCLQCDELISHKFRNGWRLMSGESVHLCDRCVSVFEEGRFCEMFHSKDDGWRTCVSCKKLVHCGCIVSFQDFGTVNCIQCSKAKFILVNSAFCHHLQVSNENLETLDSWLERKVNEWMNSEKNLVKSSKSSWWSFIESDFQWLFRDITRQLWIVYDNGKSHGSIEDHIFVDGTRGVLYPGPLIGPQGLNAQSLNADIKSLKKMMIEVIGKPFGIEDIQTDLSFWTGVNIGNVHCQGCLPINLQSFIYDLEGEFMNTTNVKFMLDSYFFWTRPERVHFFNKFVDLMSRGEIDYYSLSGEFRWPDWGDLLIGTEFQKAYDLYYSPPHSDLDLVRFCKNELWHHNDKYKGTQEYDKMLDQEEIEATLNNIFEGVYWRIKQSLLDYSLHCDPIQWKKIREKLLGPTI